MSLLLFYYPLATVVQVYQYICVQCDEDIAKLNNALRQLQDGQQQAKVREMHVYMYMDWDVPAPYTFTRTLHTHKHTHAHMHICTCMHTRAHNYMEVDTSEFILLIASY